jgi:pimeloyl-ACP methyl ester carboxylesterase
MPRVQLPPVEIEYESFGDAGAPAVLLIAGLGTQMIRWAAPFCESFAARGFRVIRYDNRDAGLSTHFSEVPLPDLGAFLAALGQAKRPEIPYNLSDMAKDALGLLDALGIAKAHVVGRSMGGMIAQLIAAEYPERVLTLTSISSTTGNPSLPQASSEAMAAMRAPTPNPNEDEAGFLAHALRIARVNAGSRFPFDEEFIRAQARTEARRAFDPLAAVRQHMAIAADGDRRERLRRIVAPTLVIHGEDDRLLPWRAGEGTAASISGAVFKKIPGMGHEIPPGFYEECVELIAAHALARAN